MGISTAAYEERIWDDATGPLAEFRHGISKSQAFPRTSAISSIHLDFPLWSFDKVPPLLSTILNYKY
jgi:hypothetical protein